MALEATLSVARPGESWLDIGCGTGRLMERLAHAGLVVVGADADRAMLRSARQRLTGHARGARLVGATAEALPLADGAVDGIVAASLLGCVAQPQALFREARRTLRPGGHFVATFTNRVSRLLRLNYRLPRRWRTSVPSRESDGAFTLYDRAEAGALLRAAGFDIVTLRFYNHVLHIGGRLLPPRGIALALDRKARDVSDSRWARNFVVVARKPAKP